MVENSSPNGQGGGTAVLCSAGLDSAVLLADEALRGPVVPVYVGSGLAWEADERRLLAELVASPPLPWARGDAGSSWSSRCATSIRPRTGRSRARPPRSTRRTRTSTSSVATSSC